MSRLKRAATKLGFGLAIFASTTAFADAGSGDGARPALLDVTLNGQRSADPVQFLQGADGSLYAGARTFAQWRLRTPPETPIRFDGELYYRLSALPALQVRLSEQDQAVTIVAPPTMFETQRTSLGADEDMPMTPPGSGLFMTYDLLLEHQRGSNDASGAFETGVFTSHGVGVTSFIAAAGSSGERLVRLESSWEIDRPGNATSLRIGDSVSIPGPGVSPVRFAGFHFFRNYAVRPGFLTMPLPAATGSAAVPSVVDIYVNNILQGSRDVAPGPFELANIPVQSGGGTVQLVVRDLLGRQVVSEQSYYASSQLLRRGLHDFSYEAGFIRRDFGSRSNRYGEFMASTTHRYGVTDQLTAEATLQASASRQGGSVAITSSALGFGQAGASVSLSHGDKGLGYRLAGSFERRGSSLSFGLLSEYQSSAYGFIGMPDGYRPPRLTVQAFADMPLSRGSLGFNLLHRSLRDQPSETLAGLYGSFQLSRFAQVQLYARHSIVGTGETTVGAHMTFSLGGRRSTYVGSEYRGGRASGEISFQDNLPSGVGGAFRAITSFGPVRRSEAAYTYNLPMATIGGQVARAGGNTGLRLTASGSIGLLGGNAFATRSLGSSFATVIVDGYPGLKVYADEHLVGVTGRDGSITIPGLRAFEANRIRIDEADLPLDAHIDSNEVVVRPFARTGAVLHFPVHAERGVLMHVRRADGSDLPAGAVVRGEGDATYTVASGGEVYAPDLAGTQRLTVTWEGGACTFDATVPAGDDPQPRLDGLICRNEASDAAH